VRALILITALLVLATGGCSSGSSKTDSNTEVTPERGAPITTATSSGAASSASSNTSSPLPPEATPTLVDTHPGDAARGRELVARFECARCHDGAGVEPTPTNKHCVHCHQDLASGKLGAGSPEAPKWREHTAHLRVVPTLEGAGKRLHRGWIERFLLEPHDLRPSLSMTMPRLALKPDEARDIATYLAPDDKAGDKANDKDALAGASVERGRALAVKNGCGSCHAFTGAPALPDARAANPKETNEIFALAPDLRFARERIRPSVLVAWLLDPKSLMPGARMPKFAITREEARDLAAYVLQTPLAPFSREIPARLPVLERKVTYSEVEERVLGVLCVHCHSEPKTAIGDGGPGNGGGFGFKPRRFDVGTYRGISAGYVDAAGERQSVFAPGPDGAPHLVAALMARYAEEAGKPSPDVRGMPLGLPPLPLEDIQLVESWIAQGRPQ
jgi:mono/diheme cytochrome c family protein